MKWQHKRLSITSNSTPPTPKWTPRFASDENEGEEVIFDFNFIIDADGA
jgi:hypothetical protein